MADRAVEKEGELSHLHEARFIFLRLLATEWRGSLFGAFCV